MLGFVTTKVSAIDSKDALKRRIDEAAAIVPLERLYLSQQCGSRARTMATRCRTTTRSESSNASSRSPREVWAEGPASARSSNDGWCLSLTIYETPTFVAEAAKIWTADERLVFFAWIAAQPEAGSVVPGSGGCRKVRWSRAGMGKRGGARVVYFARLQAGELCMLLVYPKAAKDDPGPYPEGDSRGDRR